MKAKQVYDSIDQSKSTKDVNAFLEKVKAATKNFTVENESVDKKMNELYEKIKATKPDILKGSKEPKSTSAKKKVGGKKKKVASKSKTPSNGIKKPTVSSVASQIRKPGESWRDALGRAKVIFNDKKQTQLEKSKKAVDELRDFLKNDKDFKGWPRTYGKEKASDNSLERDAQRQASPPGKRVSKTGRVYYENRDNRADREANAFPRKIYLKEGGNIYNTRNLFELGGDIMVEPTILQDTPDYLVGTTTMYEMFAEGGEVSKEDFVSKSIVYDNGGESLDRYTVYTPDGSVYGMSETGAGFNQYLGEADEIPKGKHLGKKLKSVPKEIESAVLNRMEFEKGGMMADSSEVKRYAIVDENTDRIYIRNTNKEFIDLKYKELKEIYPNDKLSIIEFEKGGITKGGKVHKSEKV
jgi:cell division septum initiation protein DivIVA